MPHSTRRGPSAGRTPRGREHQEREEQGRQAPVRHARALRGEDDGGRGEQEEPQKHQHVQRQDSREARLATCEDADGNMWFGTDGVGLYRYVPTVGPHHAEQAFTHDSTANGLCDDTISDLLVDRRGGLWVGTMFGGMSRFDGVEFDNFTRDGVIQGVETSGLFHPRGPRRPLLVRRLEGALPFRRDALHSGDTQRSLGRARLTAGTARAGSADARAVVEEAPREIGAASQRDDPHQRVTARHDRRAPPGRCGDRAHRRARPRGSRWCSPWPAR